MNIEQARSRRRSPVEADPPGTATRRAALRLLDAVLRRGDPLDLASHAACQGLAPNDRAFAIAIASETLRWLVDIDALIDSATSDVLGDDVKARTVLRLGLAQLLVLDSPPHAVVSTALPLVAGGPRRLVHAILSRAQKDGWKLPAQASLPDPVKQRWTAQWGADMAAAAATAWSVAPPVDLSFADADSATAFDEGQSLAPGHRRLPRSGRIDTVPDFASGDWWVQDLAASIPARLLGLGDGRTILDLCAAPGGKTMQLAAAGWHVTAIDSSAKRLIRLTENLARTGLAAETLQADIRTWEPPTAADAILLDAPCSATGIFRRHPDVLHRIEPRNIADLAALQQQLLARAAEWVKPGGALVFATCSLEPAEGEDQIAVFLATHAGWTIHPVRSDELPSGILPHPDGWVRTLPDMLVDQGGLDGFFVARLRAPSAWAGQTVK